MLVEIYTDGDFNICRDDIILRPVYEGSYWYAFELDHNILVSRIDLELELIFNTKITNTPLHILTPIMDDMTSYINNHMSNNQKNKTMIPIESEEFTNGNYSIRVHNRYNVYPDIRGNRDR